MKKRTRRFVIFAAAAAASCSPATWADVERVRELAGDVCLEHDGWEACLKKCDAEAERREAAE